MLVYLTGKPRRGVGPHDVAIALVRAVFDNGFVKNKVLEFVGPGIANLPMDFRNGIDVMTTETTCLSSIWETDEKTEAVLDQVHGRRGGLQAACTPETAPITTGMIEIDLSQVEPMIALPFHPSNAYTIHEFQQNAREHSRARWRRTRSPDWPARPTCDLTEQDPRRPASGWTRALSPAAPAACSTTSCEAADHPAGAEPWATATFSCPSTPPACPSVWQLTNDRRRRGAAGEPARSSSPAFCGPCFGAGRRAGQQRPVHPPHHPQLPQPGGQQARRRARLPACA